MAEQPGGESHARAEITPDYLGPGLRAVFCKTVVADSEGQCTHFCSSQGDEFWALLFLSGLTPVRLTHEDDWRILEFGFGLTSLVKRRVRAQHGEGFVDEYDVDALVEKIKRYKPQWVVFIGKEGPGAYLRSQGHPGWVRYGLQGWEIGRSAVFVVPNTTYDNLRAEYEGRIGRLPWFRELAQIVGETDVPLHIGR